MILHDIAAVDPREIAEIHVQSWKEFYPGIIPQAHLDSLEITQRVDLWRRVSAMREHWGRVCEVEGRKAGFISAIRARESIDGHDFELAAIYILKAFHGRGVGRFLVKDLAERLESQSFYAWVLEENPSRGFYERLGCVVVGRKEVEIGGKKLQELAYSFRSASLS